MDGDNDDLLNRVDFGNSFIIAFLFSGMFPKLRKGDSEFYYLF